MTERLAALLRQETDALNVPTPDTGQILGDGRRQRRRRALAQGAAGTAVLALALVVGGVAIDQGFGDQGRHRSDLPAASAEQLQGWAVASGSTVQLGTGGTAHVDGQVRSVYYTSAGVLVRSGAEAVTDAPDSTYVLVDADGRASGFELDLGDRVPGTDPTQPYLVYADATDDPDRWNVVVRDVRTGEVAQTIPVTGAFTWGGWVAPPVALSGDHAYVGMDDATLDVDLTEATVTPSAALPAHTMPTVSGGREVIENDRDSAARVVDAQTGETLLQQSQHDRLLSLSPDGRHAIAVPWRSCDQDGHCTWDKPTGFVYDVNTGNRSTIDLSAAEYGWTPQGDLLRVTDDAVDVCDADGSACRSTPVDLGGRNLRLGGTSYES